jgi:hypothetical protein
MDEDATACPVSSARHRAGSEPAAPESRRRDSSRRPRRSSPACSQTGSALRTRTPRLRCWLREPSRRISVCEADGTQTPAPTGEGRRAGGRKHRAPRSATLLGARADRCRHRRHRIPSARGRFAHLEAATYEPSRWRIARRSGHRGWSFQSGCRTRRAHRTLRELVTSTSQFALLAHQVLLCAVLDNAAVWKDDIRHPGVMSRRPPAERGSVSEMPWWQTDSLPLTRMC